MGQLEGKVALVTGAAVGIGRAIAVTYGREGAKVVVNYSRSRADAEETAQQVERAGGEALLIQADVAKDGEVRSMVAQTLEKYGRIDILVNNAGITAFVDFAKLDAGILQVAHSIPYSDVKDLSKRELEVIMEQGYPLEFGHSLTNLLGGQLDAGLVLVALYEDYKTDSPLSNFHPSYLATRAVKPPVPLG